MLLHITIFSLTAAMALLEAWLTKNGNVFYRSKQRKVLNIMMLFFLILISGTRLMGGTDYYIYEQSYNSVPTLFDVLNRSESVSSNFWLAGMDFGYIVITSIFKSIGISFHGFCFIHACFFYFSMYKGLRNYCNNFSIILLVFLCKVFFYNTFVSMRQSITIAIFFLALSLIKEKKIVPYMILSIIAVTIHAGAIIMIPIYFIDYIKLNKRRYTIFVIGLLPFAILNIFGINVIGVFAPIIRSVFSLISSTWANKAENYLTSSSSLSLFYVFEFLLIAILVWKYYDEIVGMDERCEFFIKIFLCLWPIFTVFGGMEIVTREKDYFILSYGVLLCYLIQMRKRRYRQIIILGTIAICCFEYFRYIIMFDNGHFLNYQSWLFG